MCGEEIWKAFISILMLTKFVDMTEFNGVTLHEDVHTPPTRQILIKELSARFDIPPFKFLGVVENFPKDPQNNTCYCCYS